MTRKSAFIYDSYNARVLTYKQLSDSFITNKSFFELAGQNNTVLIGPRGSGKTTLLKMLQIEALSLWEGKEAEDCRDKIKYTGVFIPTDIVWHKQQKKLLETTKNYDLVAKYINDIFILHVLECLLQALIFRINNSKEYRRILLSYDIERELVKTLATQWKLFPEVYTLRGLYASVILKSHYMLNLVSNDNFDDPIHIKKNFCGFPDITQSLSTSIRQINNMLSEDDGCWCFLFDELELAPDQITSDLINAMRGANPNIIYKLSLSPYNENINNSITIRDAMESQDFSIVYLPDSRDLDFAERLCESVFRKKSLSLDAIEKFEKIDYRKEFSELAKKDKSFLRYLNRKNISIEDIELYTDKSKKPEIRKIRWSVLLRNYYLNNNLSLRSKRRPANFYAGFSNICTSLEYNPRMLIGTMNRLVQQHKNGRISFSSQISALQHSSNGFNAILNTISVESDEFYTVQDLIQKISTKICNNFILGKEFFDEPRGVFFFKEEPNGKIAAALGDALNTGAIVNVSDRNTSEFNISKFVGKKFRVSYIFSPTYKLPLTKLSPIDYKKLINLELDANSEVEQDNNNEQMELDL